MEDIKINIDDKKENNISKDKKKVPKFVYIIILLIIVLVGCLVGYFVSQKSKDNDKEDKNEVVEESNNKEEEKEQNDNETVDTDEETVPSVKEAEELIKKYHYEYTLNGTQPQYYSGYTESIKFDLSYLNASDKIKKVNCSDYANVKKVDSNLYTLKGKYEDFYYCDKKTNAISYDNLNNSYKELFGSNKDLKKESYNSYIYNSKKDYFVEFYPIVGNAYPKENIYGVQNVKFEDNKLIIEVGYVEFEYVEGSIDGDYSSCDIYIDDEERMAECISVIEDTVHFTTEIDNHGKVAYTWAEFNEENFIKDFKEKYLDDLPTYTFIFEKENDNYVFVDFYQN